LIGAGSEYCELRKMYFLPAARGRGVGATLLRRLLAEAAASGFARCYLETLASMTRARALYEAAGFRAIAAPLGATGHFGCDRWYLRDLP
jgi:putative acetyltransferase